MALRVNGSQEAADVVGLVWFLRLLIVQHWMALGPGLPHVLPFACSDMARLHTAGCPGEPVITAQQEGWEPPMLFWCFY